MATFLFDKIIFGPVYSRRLGISLGINLLPNECKVCNFNCIYCECGLTPDISEKQINFHKQKDIYKALLENLKLLKNNNELVETITFAGNGEPTLHPELCKIVKMIKEYGLNVFLLTNGVLIYDDYLRKLKKSGLDYIMFHIDPWQKRPDLPEKPKFEDVKMRLKELTTMAYSHGIDVSISMTLNNEDKETLIKYNQF